MRHHPENIRVAVFFQNFTGAVARMSKVAVVDTSHGSPRGFSILLHAALSIAVSIQINIRLMTLDQRLPLRKSAARSNAKQVLVGDFVGERFANLVTRESKCRRITVRPWHEIGRASCRERV